jgi:hypothetical protein
VVGVTLAFIAVLIFIALLAATFISAGVAFGLIEANGKLADRLFKVAITTGCLCLFIALMLILTTQIGGLE